jgi:hypothetical protein
VKLGHTKSLQLFVCREPEIVWAVRQKGSKKFFFPDLPGLRILPWGPRMLRGAPEALPGLTTLVDPDRGIGATANALGPSDKVMCHESRELQQAACFRITESALKLADADLWLEVIFVNADDATHA